MNLDDLLKDFLEEAFEKIEIIDDNLLSLENEPNNEDYLNEIFRAAHTVKGSAGTMGYEDLCALMHSIENIFTLLKENKMDFSADINDFVLKAMDIVKVMLKNIESKGEEGVDAKEIKKQLKAIETRENKDSKKTVKKAKSTVKKEEKSVEQVKDVINTELFNIDITKIEKDILKQEFKQNKKLLYLKIVFSQNSAMPSVGRFIIIREIENNAKIIKSKPSIDILNSDDFIESGLFVVSVEGNIDSLKSKIFIPNEVEDIQILPFIIDDKEENISNENKSKSNIKSEIIEDEKDIVVNSDNLTKKESIQSLRVDSYKIDELLNLIGEQVINTSRYFRLENEFDKRLYEIKSLISSYSSDNLEFIKKLSQLLVDFKKLSEEFKETNLMTRRLNSEMQQNTMKIRMLPIDKVFKRFPRMIRDISRELGKKIELKIEGQDTELDKTVIEVLGDPLVHIIRNALDHGIETQEERIACGKSAEGHITLKAKHEGNYIFIEVIDDGKGLSREKILDKALQKGLIMEGMKDSLKDKEIFSLVFEPGFSTATSVTGLSGRGVGMDVVRKSMEKVNGTVEMESEQGKGTVVRIKLPLTMAIIQALLVSGLGQVYSIPLNSVEETVKLSKKDLFFVKGHKTINIRNNVISVISIEEIFRYPEKEREDYYIVILDYADKKVGLIVDKLYGEQEVVIKNLDSDLVITPGIAGANILGDGRVSLILDINKLIERINS
ncbi:MAG: chemotaxis protein CheA [Candidatus Muirbacterium halophilum]|nr:chemotaxis protein CheA [Candidatus Muirbacterium halophilum]MCK9476204.1 chemotaxis protein CheA [Candidatus Muirbacterium halophilum]